MSGVALRYGSVCSGIEAATAAWHPLGWQPAFFSEIEKFPSRVIATHYPMVPNHGDMTKFRDWPDHAIDILVGGTPCQSFSVAGLRAGLADPRGNLALIYLAIADRYRPRWIVWENVPGVLSSGGGRDFGAIIGGMVELGYGIAYRVLDAQYVRVDGLGRAVPQRRRRVFVVGYLDDWRRAAAVLFDRESLLGNPPPRRQSGQRPAPTIAARTRGGGGLGTDFDCDGGLIASSGRVAHCLNAGALGRIDYETETMVAHALRREGHDASEDGTGRGTPIVPVKERLKNRPRPSRDELADGLQPYFGETFPIAIQGAATRENPASGPDGIGVRTDGAAYTLEARQEVQVIAFDCKAGANTGFAIDEIPGALRGEGHGGGHAAVAFDMRGREGGAQSWAVRRLMPIECERLQGFPDGYTDVPPRGKNHTPDGPRYKALGNSMAVNVMRWIGTRIQMVECAS